jgi:hypothetical protein
MAIINEISIMAASIMKAWLIINNVNGNNQ